MNPILIKLFATALTLAQVTVSPDTVRTEFDPVGDRAVVVQLLKDGCQHMRKAFDIEDLNLDELIDTAMKDPQAVTGGPEIKAFKGLNFSDLFAAYRQFCKGEQVETSAVDIGEVITAYNRSVADLPDHNKLKNFRLPGTSTVLDDKGKRFAEVFEPDHRRIWVPIAEIPQAVQKAFVAAEDKRFFEHRGIDERSVIRAFMNSFAKTGRPQGGSTITQQVAKNLLVGDDVTYERKMREMIVAARLERTLSKPEILELYLNSIYLGRGSWGIEMAAKSYFGKSAKDMTLEEGALLAGLTKGPSFYNPDRHPERVQQRLSYVLGRLAEDGAISAQAVQQAVSNPPRPIAYDRLRREVGFHYVDYVAREAKKAAQLPSLTADSYVVRSTIHPELQRATETALQDGLARYERQHGRARFAGAEMNLGDAVRKIEAKGAAAAAGAADPANPAMPPWRQAFQNARMPLYDLHWTSAIVLDKGSDKAGMRVGLRDGRIVPLSVHASVRKILNQYDVVYVTVSEGKGKAGTRADLRSRPKVQGSAIVLENKTGKVLAMAGGFSYPLSQLNRTSQSQRQPGSALKPLSYLAALSRGLQPNTIIPDTPLTLPPIGGTRYAQAKDYWSPKNYDGGSAGQLTLRRALENSKNLATAHLLDGGIADEPEKSLDRLCELAKEAQVYTSCMRYYPFVLGAQPVRPIDLAAFYAAIANEGTRPTPYAVESISKGEQVIYRHQPSPGVRIGSADNVAFFQLKTMLQGVLSRGTARSIAAYAPYVGGKTGTSDDENDAWFVGFTNDVTVAVWVGYDNDGGKRRTLGGGATGGHTAVPIFDPIIKAVWQHHSPKVALAPPSPEAKRNMIAVAGDGSEDETGQSRGRFVEYFRAEKGGRYKDTQYALISRGSSYSRGYDLDGYPTTQYDSRPFSERPARDFWSWGNGWGSQNSWGQNSWSNQNAWPQRQQQVAPQRPQQPVQRQQRQFGREEGGSRREPDSWWSNRQ
jgi:membrane carboxypeptidase/penicillin-binding protein